MIEIQSVEMDDDFAAMMIYAMRHTFQNTSAAATNWARYVGPKFPFIDISYLEIMEREIRNNLAKNSTWRGAPEIACFFRTVFLPELEEEIKNRK